MITANELSQHESGMESCQMPQSSAISTHSSVKGTPQAIREWLTLLPEDSRASHSALPGNDGGGQTNVTAGRQQSNAYAWYDRAVRCWRTFQVSLLADTSEPFSETWPKAGLIVGGKCYRLPKLERRISGIGSGLLPTPVAPNGGRQHNLDNLTLDGNTLYRQDGSKAQMYLQTYVRMWPTPRAYSHNPESNRPGISALDIRVRGMYQDNRRYWPTPTKSDGTVGPGNSGREGGDNLRTAVSMFPSPAARDYRSPNKNGNMKDQLPNVVGGQLNPTWVEWLMGWPLGWTDLRPLEMDRFRQWLEQHGR